MGITEDNTCHGKSDVIYEEAAKVVKSVNVDLPTIRSFDGHDMATIGDGVNSS